MMDEKTKQYNDVLIDFFPQVLCTLTIDYISKCQDCFKYTNEMFSCTKCSRLRCEFCHLINSNEIAFNM